MQDLPLVSIFVQAYNTEKYIAHCIQSILELRGGYPIEIIVIDDASKDRTSDVVRQFKDPRIIFRRHDANCGTINTANEGFSLARGQFVARVDSDDAYCASFLESTIPLMLSDASLGLVYGDVALIDQEGRVSSPKGNVDRNGLPASGDEYFQLLTKNHIPAPSTLMRREALMSVLPIPSALTWGDWYLTLGIAERWKLAYVDQVLANYRIHTTNMHRSMIRDRTGETTTLRVLEMHFQGLFRREEKRRWRRKIYASSYLTYADKYFGADMAEDARRCYLAAFRLNPAYLLKPAVVRRALACCLGKATYDRLKSFWR